MLKILSEIQPKIAIKKKAPRKQRLKIKKSSLHIVDSNK